MSIEQDVYDAIDIDSAIKDFDLRKSRGNFILVLIGSWFVFYILFVVINFI